MPWSEQIPIQKHMTTDQLELRIKTLEKDTKILKRLYFVKYRYDDSVRTHSVFTQLTDVPCWSFTNIQKRRMSVSSFSQFGK